MPRKHHRIVSWFERHERHLSSGALLCGFIFDNLTLRRIDLFWDQFLVFSYLVIAAITVVALSVYEAKVRVGTRPTRWHAFFLILLQFVLGGLFSAFFVFYFRSADISASWPFLLVLLGLLIGNEFLKDRYKVLTFRLTIFFVAVFSFAIFFVPVILGKIGDGVFVTSGLLSLGIVWLLVFVLSGLAPRVVRENKWRLRTSILVVFGIINLLYFTNIIPPIPLALKEGLVAQTLVKNSDGTYVISRETRSWYEFFERYPLVHPGPEGRLYVYSAIFAPTDLKTNVVHRWQYFSEHEKRWVTTHKVQFPILGGSDRGYRGFSLKNDVVPGLWRVNIENIRGQLIGRVRFEVVNGSTTNVITELR